MAASEDRLAQTIAAVEDQERRLVLAHFDHDDAWALGCWLVEVARERGMAVVISIRRGPQQLFHAALPGTSADNDAWAERKAAVVTRFGASSYLVGLRSLAKGAPFETRRADLPSDRYAAHGGSFPITVAGAGVVGSVTVSGLASEEDHALVVEALSTLRERQAAHTTDPRTS